MVKYIHIDKGDMHMLTIRNLNEETLADYLLFFDQVAFTDNPKWAGCYCTFNHFGKNELAAFEETNYSETYTRNKAIEFVKTGLLKGYLAYKEDKVVGWISSNQKNNYIQLFHEEDVSTNDDNHIKSIACFIIAPNHRKQGIASQLLVHAIQEAKKEGYTYVEAYPDTGHHDCYLNYHGYKTMFEKYGFETYKELTKCAIMRKPL